MQFRQETWSTTRRSHFQYAFSGDRVFLIVFLAVIMSTISTAANAFQKQAIRGLPIVRHYQGITTAAIATKRSHSLPRLGGFLTATFAGILGSSNNSSSSSLRSTLFSSVACTSPSNVTYCQDGHEEGNNHTTAASGDGSSSGAVESSPSLPHRVSDSGLQVVVPTTNGTDVVASAPDLNVKTPPFDESVLSYDHYNGVTLHLGDYVKWIQSQTGAEQDTRKTSSDTALSMQHDTAKFALDLETALEFWRAEGRKGIWIHAPPQTAEFIPVCVQVGFEFQQIKRGNTSINETYSNDDARPHAPAAGSNTLILSQWLPDTQSKLPLGPTHQCGVGVVVLNPRDPSQMLVVQEKSGPAAAFNLWKMPTGLSDPSEDLHEAAVRELLEETGLHATFEGIVCFRQAHRPGGATSDLFFVCHMKLIQNNVDDEVMWTPQEDEIAAIKWMSVQEFCDQERWQGSPLYTTLNDCITKLSRAVVSSGAKTISSGQITGGHPVPLPLITHQQLEVGFGRAFGGTNALFMPSAAVESNNDDTTAATQSTAASSSSFPATTEPLSPTAVAGMIDFLTLARGLKTTPRTGWVRQEAGPNIESVADHSWRIALMGMVSSLVLSSRNSKPRYDTNKCIKMALVHDLAEAVVGDITPHCGVSDQDKHFQELTAITKMTRKLCLKENGDNGTPVSSSSPNTQLVGDEILDLWREYEEGSTPEALLVKDMDKLEMILQALEYENDGRNGKSLDGFFDGTRNKWRTDIGKAWGEEIESRRKKSE
jgi:putative hydrolases of HD superfamily